MKTKLLLLIIILVSINVNSQVSSKKITDGKGYSKNESLFKAKRFLISNIIEVTEEPIEFYIDPLAAASSGELTSLIYKCEGQNKEGLLLGFYGNYWNNEGVKFKGYAFKNLNKEQATAFFKKIDDSIKNHKKFLYETKDKNNISFKYDDMTIMVWGDFQSINLRVFWGNFDSSWEKTSYDRTKKRFKKKID